MNDTAKSGTLLSDIIHAVGVNFRIQMDLQIRPVAGSWSPAALLSFLFCSSALMFPSTSHASGGSSVSDSLGLVSAIGLTIVSACILAVLFNYIKIPALLAYILSGLLLSVFTSPLLSSSIEIISHISQLGLVFLLFIIGMEMDIGGILRLGLRAALAVLLQGPIAIAAIMGIQYGASALGISIPGLGSDPHSFIYFAVACALGSTAVTVKLLGDQFDLHSKAGKITVLTLIAEDICAVMALSYVLSQSGHDGNGGSMGVMIGGAAALSVLFYLLSRFVLSRVMQRFSKSPDMLALIALGWCFMCAESISRVGLSAEMGALIAGLTIGWLPHHIEIQTKVSSLRDFFMALFFVALGMTLPLPTLSVMWQAMALVALVAMTRLLLFAPTLLWAKSGLIVSLTSAVNLSQLSEFTLLLIPIGLAGGVLTTEEGMVISYALMLSVVVTGFSIKYNYRIALLLSRLLGKDAAAEMKKLKEEAESDEPDHEFPIVMLGYFFNAEALALEIRENNPELFKQILVIDFNLQNHPQIRAHGFKVVYGDIGNLETLRHHGIAGARVILSTINNAFLRGISNQELLEEIGKINPSARVIATSDREEETIELLRGGAFRAISPSTHAAKAYLNAIEAAMQVDASD